MKDIAAPNQGVHMFSLSEYSLLEYMCGYLAQIKKANQSHPSTRYNLLLHGRWVGKKAVRSEK